MLDLISTGNRKIAKNTAIFNLCSGTDCPMKNDCFYGITKKCYALKAERLYKDCLPYRRRQAAYWTETPIDTRINDMVEFFRRKKAIKYFRINESGDIASIQDLKDLDAIAAALKAAYGIKTYTYTHNLEVLSKYTPTSIVVNVSMDSVNCSSQYAAVAVGHNVFMGLEDIRENSGFHCPGVGCMDTCKRCVVEHHALTVCKIH